MGESLQTALCEVEELINDCPIMVLSADTKDPEPLTHNDLLQMKGMSNLPPELFKKRDGNRSNTYQTSFGNDRHGSAVH